MNDEQRNIVDEQLKALLNSNVVLRKEDKDRVEALVLEVEDFYKEEIPSEKTARETTYRNYVSKIEEFGRTMASVLYNLQLTREEYLFIKDTIFKKLEYDRENVFVALMVRDEFFNKFDGEDKSTTKTDVEFDEVGGKNIAVFPIDINNLTRISHLLGLYIVKDITSRKADNFASVVKKIGDISKVFNYYKIKGEQLQTKGDNWMKGFEQYDMEELGENPESIDEVSAEKVD
jgi:hypothetical protein